MYTTATIREGGNFQRDIIQEQNIRGSSCVPSNGSYTSRSCDAGELNFPRKEITRHLSSHLHHRNTMVKIDQQWWRDDLGIELSHVSVSASEH
jgi:hypothetical protein